MLNKNLLSEITLCISLDYIYSSYVGRLFIFNIHQFYPISREFLDDEGGEREMALETVIYLSLNAAASLRKFY